MKTAGQIGYEKLCEIWARDGARPWELAWEDILPEAQEQWNEVAQGIINWHEAKASDARVSK